jgi:acyl-CoA thioesterase FadM
MSVVEPSYLEVAVVRRDLGFGVVIRPHRYLEWAQAAHEQLASEAAVPDPNILWVYVRHTARWHKPAHPIKRLRFRTWLVAAQNMSALREFSADDAETGARLFDEQVKTVALDRQTMRPTNFTLAPHAVLEGQPQRLMADVAASPDDLAPLGSFEQLVEADDVDFNQHVNNATYLRWATNALHRLLWKPGDALQPMPFVRGCEIRYLRPLQMGARLRIDVRNVPQPDASQWSLDIVDLADERRAAVVTVLADAPSGA